MPADKLPPTTVQQRKADLEARRPPAEPIHPQPPQHNHHLHFPRLPHLHLRRHQHRSHSTPPPTLNQTNPAMSSKPSASSSKASLNSAFNTTEARFTPSLDSAKSTLQAVATTTLRPSSNTRPSWIGPTRPATPGLRAMPQPVTLTYSSPGLQPPVFIFTSLSDPQWEAVEMDAMKDDKGEWTFTKSFSAEPGDYQYKFRLGPGEWWALDDKQETVDDGFGNKNNSLVVKEPEKRIDPAPPMVPEVQPAPTPAPASDPPEASHIVAPLMPHEHFSPEPPARDVDPEMNEDDPWIGDGEDNEPDGSPLLRHETLGPHMAEQEHSPLFRHETVALGEHKDNIPPTPLKSSAVSSPVAPEADPHDPFLECFPSDHHGIMETIHRTATQIAADETTDESIRSPVVAPKEIETALSPVTSLPSVQEDEEETRLATETNDPPRPSVPMTPPMTPKEEEQIVKDIVVGLMAGETVDQAVERAVEVGIAREELTAAVEKDQMENDGQELPQKLLPGAVQLEGQSLVDYLTTPVVCLAVVGIAVGVTAAGVYAARGWISDLLQKL